MRDYPWKPQADALEATEGDSVRSATYDPCGLARLLKATRVSESQGISQRAAGGGNARVGKLRAYGNAIVPQVAATFLRAFLDSMEDQFYAY